MQKITYIIKAARTIPNLDGTTTTEDYQGCRASMPYSEANLAIAQSEAWPGTLEIVDDGQPEPEVLPSTEDTLLELAAETEYRLCMLELGAE